MGTTVNQPETSPAEADHPVILFLNDLPQHNEIRNQLRTILRNPADVEDALQETLLRAYKGRNTFNPDLGKVTGWIKGIAPKVAAEIQRKQCRRKEEQQPEEAYQWDSQNRAKEVDQETQDLRERFKRGLEQLTNEERTILQWRAEHELDFKTIAGRLGCTALAARKKYQRAKEALQAVDCQTEGGQS